MARPRGLIRTANGAGLEPVPCDITQFAVPGVIHMNERFQAVASTELREQGLLKFPLDQHGSRIIEEGRIILAAGQMRRRNEIFPKPGPGCEKISKICLPFCPQRLD